MENIQAASEAVKTIFEIAGPAGGLVILVIIAAVKFRGRITISDGQVGAADILKRVEAEAAANKEWRKEAEVKLDKLADTLQRIEVEVAKKSPRR